MSTRGEDLLKAIVTETEFSQYRLNGYIKLNVDYGEYWVSYSGCTFVDHNRQRIDMCIVFKNEDPSLDVGDEENPPSEDYLIMKYLLIKGNPRYFWQTAVKSPARAMPAAIQQQ